MTILVSQRFSWVQPPVLAVDRVGIKVEVQRNVAASLICKNGNFIGAAYDIF